MVFWILISALALIVVSLMLRALLSRRAQDIVGADYDIAVYRDQLDEVTRDLDRGVINPDVAERTSTEISRRILEADKARAQGAVQSGRTVTWITAAIVGIFLVGGSLAMYQSIGAPGYGDLPLKDRLAMSEELRAARPDQAAAEAQLAGSPRATPAPEARHAELVEQLRDAVASRPDDLRGLTLLAQNEAALGNYAQAHRAQARVIEVLGPDAQGRDYADYGDLLILAAGGYVSPQAETALARALDMDPQNGTARYYSGLMYVQTGRPDLGFQIWRTLLEDSTADAPWVPPIRAQIEDVALRAGVAFEVPPLARTPGLSGPSQDDIAAAQDMSPEDRTAMIRGMVDGLSDRLATQGGPPEDWARLIGALGVLGDTDQASGIYSESRSVFAANPAALDLLDEAARRVGIAP